jgi:hypothetical protein
MLSQCAVTLTSPVRQQPTVLHFSILSLDWPGTHTLIPNSRTERQYLISQQNKTKHVQYLSTVNLGTCGSNEVRTQPVDTWSGNEQPATVGYPTDGSVGEVAEMTGTLAAGGRARHRWKHVIDTYMCMV